MQRLVRHLERQEGWRALVTSFGLGALGALAYPPLHLLPVLLLALPGLVILLGRAGSGRRAAMLGWAWGWGHQIVGLYWITHAILTEADRLWWLVPLAVPALAIPMGAYTILPALAAWRARPGWPRALAFAGTWVIAEMLRGWVATGFPWNLLGTAWAFDALPIQSAAWIGVHGLSLATALLALTPLLGRRAMLGGAVALLAFAGFGLARLWPEEPAPEPVTLVLVQGNVAQEAKWREETRWPIFRRYLELSRQGLDAAASEAPGTRPVVVWPETASPFLLADDPEARRIVATVLRPDAPGQAGDPAAAPVLLAGTVRGEWGPDGRARRLWNSLVAVGSAGEVQATYDKAHLVPFGEYMPLAGLLPIRVVRGGVDFQSGPGRVPFAVPGLPVASALICYEVIFPGAVSTPARPGWLLNVTNDAWFGISAGPYQHLAAARMRAVEEGLPLARAAQTGISAVFDSRGRTVARLPLGESGVLLSPLPRAGAPTPASRLGLLPPMALALACAATGLIASRRREKVVA